MGRRTNPADQGEAQGQAEMYFALQHSDRAVHAEARLGDAFGHTTDEDRHRCDA
jgi:hypothetical protein